MIVDIIEATHRNTVGEIPSEHELCSVVMNLELRHLRAVVAVADHGSFTTAAVQLGVSQPALTRTVQQAERILQTQLFDRTSRRVELAESATDFVTAAKRMLFDLGTRNGRRLREGHRSHRRHRPIRLSAASVA